MTRFHWIAAILLLAGLLGPSLPSLAQDLPVLREDEAAEEAEAPAAPAAEPKPKTAEDLIEDALVEADGAATSYDYDRAIKAIEQFKTTMAAEKLPEQIEQKLQQLQLLAQFWQSVPIGAAKLKGYHTSIGGPIGKVTDADDKSFEIELPNGKFRRNFTDLGPKEVYLLGKASRDDSAQWHLVAGAFCLRYALPADGTEEMNKAKELGAKVPVFLLELDDWYNKRAERLYQRATQLCEEGNWLDASAITSDLLKSYARSLFVLANIEKVQKLNESAMARKGVLNGFARLTRNGAKIIAREDHIEMIFDFSKRKQLNCWSITGDTSWEINKKQLRTQTKAAAIGLWLDVEFAGPLEIDVDAQIVPYQRLTGYKEKVPEYVYEYDFQIAFCAPGKDQNAGYRAFVPSGGDTKLVLYGEGSATDVGMPYSLDTVVDPEKTYQFKIVTSPKIQVIRNQSTLLRTDEAVPAEVQGYLGLSARTGAIIKRVRVVGTPSARWMEEEAKRLAKEKGE